MDHSSPEIFEVDYGRIIKVSDNMAILQLLDNLQIDYAEAEQMVTDMRSTVLSDEIRLMIIYGLNSDLTFKAQRYLATVQGFSRVAFVVHTRLQVQVGQFFISLFKALKSTYEFRLFDNADLALAWLRQQ